MVVDVADEGENRIRAAYVTTKYDRLIVVRNQCDPTILFRLSQNIRPTA
jgi:hypothetical protein